MSSYDKEKDLARILLEGTKTVYGKEVSAKLQSEFERQRKLPVYRGNAEELTAIVDRVCGQEASQADVVDAKAVKSIDDAVNTAVYQPKPSMLKVAAHGMLNLVNKTYWYYPLVG